MPPAVLKAWCSVVLLLCSFDSVQAQLFIVNPQTNAAPPVLNLVWSASPDTNVAGYLLAWGYARGGEVNQLDVQNVTAVSLAGFGTNTTYYFTVSAYAANGLDSAASNELSYSVPGSSTNSANSPPTNQVTLALTLVQSASGPTGGMVLSWNTVVGQSYQVQYKTNLGQGSWNNLGGPVVSTNGTMVVSDTGGDPQRYYRVVLQQ